MEIKKLEKASMLKGLDTVVFDLEDGVPMNLKPIGRKNIIEYLSKPRTIIPELAIRINAVDSKESMKDLNEVLLNESIAKQFKSLVIAKVEDPDEVRFVSRWLKLNNYEHMKILALIETPLGLTKINEICKSSPALDAIIYGAEDYRSASGISKEFGDSPIMYARSSLVASARAHNLQVIDMTSLDFKRSENVIKEAQLSKSFGFTGKQVIHPMQIECVNQAYAPSEKDINNSIELITRFIRTQIVEGKGVYGAEGNMVELPHVKDAVQTLIYGGKAISEIQKIADEALK